MPTIALQDARFANIAKSARDTINMAASEPQWQGACHDMYTACQTISDQAGFTPQDTQPVQQELNDVSRMLGGGSKFAHAQGTWASAAIVLYQTMTDATLSAGKSTGSGPDKLDILKNMAPSCAQYAHKQGQWDDAAIVLYQGYRDMQKVSENNIAGLSPEQQTKLNAVHSIAMQTEQSALQQQDWNQAASAMYAGIDSINSVLNS
ncbi:MAG TPA: hypothetical protein VGO93_11110 [Candidatus Xenobia bacterium]|jgi:hypothetical protein